MGQTFKVDTLASQAERTFQQYRGTPPRSSTPPSGILGKASARLWNSFTSIITFCLLSGENHDGMLVERINRYLNKGLKVMTIERDSVRVATEVLLLLIYAWNSAPIPGTNLPRSLVVCGRVFQFPIDISAAKHLDLSLSPASVESYAKDQAMLLSASIDIARVPLMNTAVGIVNWSMLLGPTRASTTLVISYLQNVILAPTLPAAVSVN
jgi:hypothetical protein